MVVLPANDIAAKAISPVAGYFSNDIFILKMANLQLTLK